MENQTEQADVEVEDAGAGYYVACNYIIEAKGKDVVAMWKGGSEVE